jgi:hypothetical protein
VNTCNKTTLNNMNLRTSQHKQKTWSHVIRQHWTTWTSWSSCCSMLSYYMWSCFLFMLWCPEVHVVQCCLITCVHVFCLCCDVLKFMLFNVVLLHVFTFFVHVVMSWSSCCSMVSYYMCSRFLFMLWCPEVHVVQWYLITCVHVFCSCCDVLGSCCSMLSYYMCSRFLFMLWCPGVHVVQCCLITCVHVFCSCCDVLGFMLFNVVLLHVFTFFIHVVMSWGSCCSMLSYYMWSRFLFMLWWPGVRVVQCCLITCVHVFCSCCDVLHVIRQHWTTWTPGHHNMNKKREHM